MFKVYKKQIEVAGKKISLETGKVARQADGAIIAPSACRAIFPVSKIIFFPSTSISCLDILNIYFLKFNFVNMFLYESILFLFK